MEALEAWYKFDDLSAQDSTAYGHHGRWEGQEAYARGRSGLRVPPDAAAVFSGSSRIVVDSFAMMSLSFGAQFSVSLWFKRTGGEGNYQGIVS